METGFTEALLYIRKDSRCTEHRLHVCVRVRACAGVCVRALVELMDQQSAMKT